MKYVFPFMLIKLLFLLSCNQVAKLTQFEMDYSETVVVPSSTGINLPFNLISPAVETNSESTFAVNDTRKDLIEEIQLKKLSLSLTSPTTSNFSFLNSIEIFIKVDDLSEIKIAWENEVPSNSGDYLELETTKTDLKEYIKKDNFTLRVNTVTDKLLTSDHHILIESLFFVDAKVLGQ